VALLGLAVLALGTGLAMAALFRLAADGADQERLLGNTGTYFMAYLPAPAAGGSGLFAGLTPTAALPPDLLGRLGSAAGPIAEAAPYLFFRLPEGGTGRDLAVGGLAPGDRQTLSATCCAPSDLVAGRYPADAGEGILADAAWATAQGRTVGQTVDAGALRLRIAGIVNPGPRPARADLYLELGEARRLWRASLPGEPPEANILLIRSRRADLQEAAMALVRERLPGAVTVSYACWQPSAEAAAASGRTMAVVAGLAFGLAFLAALGLRWAALEERRRDFAILRAAGWGGGPIGASLLAESLLPALAAWLLGLAGPAAVLAGRWLRGAGEPLADLAICLPVAAAALVVLLAATGLAWLAALRRVLGADPLSELSRR
jgi:putative ABC transport system permease protein